MTQAKQQSANLVAIAPWRHSLMIRSHWDRFRRTTHSLQWGWQERGWSRDQEHAKRHWAVLDYDLCILMIDLE